MKYEIRDLSPPIQGAVAEVRRDSINGDVLLIGQEGKLLVIRIQDLVLEIAALEAKKQIPEPVINGDTQA